MSKNQDLLVSVGVLILSFLVFSGTFYNTYLRQSEGITGTFSIPNKAKAYCVLYGDRPVGEASVDYKNDELLSILIIGKVNLELVGMKNQVNYRFEAVANVLGQLMSSRGTLFIGERILEADVKGITPLVVKLSERSDSPGFVPMLPPVSTEIRGTVELKTLSSGKENDLLEIKLPTGVRVIKEARFSAGVMEELARYTGVGKPENFGGVPRQQPVMNAVSGLRLRDGVCDPAANSEYLPVAELLHRVQTLMPAG